MNHPLRTIRAIVRAAPADEFSALNSPKGRPPNALEKPLRTLLLRVFYAIRSNRDLM
jgi:transposase